MQIVSIPKFLHIKTDVKDRKVQTAKVPQILQALLDQTPRHLRRHHQQPTLPPLLHHHVRVKSQAIVEKLRYRKKSKQLTLCRRKLSALTLLETDTLYQKVPAMHRLRFF